jgi:hypothetical protein
VGQQFADDVDALLNALAAAIDRFRHSLTKNAVVVDQCVADFGEGQAT